MELLQYILNSVMPGKAEQFAPLLSYAVQNNFNVKSMLENLDVSALAPLVSRFFSSPAENPRQDAPAAASPLEPIASVADKDIVYCLNRYLSGAAE